MQKCPIKSHQSAKVSPFRVITRNRRNEKFCKRLDWSLLLLAVKIKLLVRINKQLFSLSETPTAMQINQRSRNAINIKTNTTDFLQSLRVSPRWDLNIKYSWDNIHLFISCLETKELPNITILFVPKMLLLSTYLQIRSYFEGIAPRRQTVKTNLIINLVMFFGSPAYLPTNFDGICRLQSSTVMLCTFLKPSA